MSDTAWTDDDDSPLAPLDVQPVGVEWVSVDDMVPEWGRRVPVEVGYSWGWQRTIGYWAGADWWYLSEHDGWQKSNDVRWGRKGEVEAWFNLPARERGEE